MAPLTIELAALQDHADPVALLLSCMRHREVRTRRNARPSNDRRRGPPPQARRSTVEVAFPPSVILQVGCVCPELPAEQGTVSALRSEQGERLVESPVCRARRANGLVHLCTEHNHEDQRVAMLDFPFASGCERVDARPPR